MAVWDDEFDYEAVDPDPELVVQHSDNRRLWHTVCDPAQPDPVSDEAARTGNRSSVVCGREQLTWNRYRLTRLPWAEQAMRVWLGSAQRDTTLPWWEATANWPATRPRLFNAADL